MQRRQTKRKTILEKLFFWGFFLNLSFKWNNFSLFRPSFLPPCPWCVPQGRRPIDNVEGSSAHGKEQLINSSFTLVNLLWIPLWLYCRLISPCACAQVVTKDLVRPELSAVCYYQIENVALCSAALCSLTTMLQSLLQAVIRDILAQHTFSHILLHRRKIGQKIQAGADSVACRWGIRVERADM